LTDSSGQLRLRTNSDFQGEFSVKASAWLGFIFAAAITITPQYFAHAEPVGAPGIPHRWAPAMKQAIGTAYEEGTASSPVWFTLAQGILTEVFYPSPDQAQVGDLQFIVTDGQGFFSEQKTDCDSHVTYLDEGMTVVVTGQEKTGRYTFEQEIVADPAAPVVRIKTTFHWNQPGLRLFTLFKPAINNTGAQNLASASEQGLFATKDIVSNAGNVRTSSQVYAALVPSIPFVSVSTGYVGYSDGWQDLSKNFHITVTDREAGPGNVALTGEIPVGGAPDFTYDIALGFGGDLDAAQTLAQTSLQVPFESVKANYEAGWRGYLGELSANMSDKRFFSESTFARRSAQIIRMHEDKANPGAIVASLSNPAVPESDNAMDGSGGYHLVWPRDLYHAAMGLMAAGDTRTPVNVLHYLEKNQKSDGSWAQNFWVDGTPYWRGLQMDEVGFPILLAAQVQSRGLYRLTSTDLDVVKRAASFILSHGPSTQEDRWEEIGGYLPDTIATEVAALKVATTLTGDSSYATVANQWQSLIERWTLAPQGIWGKNYYIRVSPNGTPENPEPIQIANGGGQADATDILDGGFLNLVRLGIRSANDPRILTTLQAYDNPDSGIAATDPTGAITYRRYSKDSYGEGRVGGYWPLLAGERGHYSILAGDMDQARAQLYIVEKSAIDSGLIPEQTIGAPTSESSNGSNAGLGVACPLVWAHAEDILLHRSIEEGNVFDSPRTGP
jgi:glucoamylase